MKTWMTSFSLAWLLLFVLQAAFGAALVSDAPQAEGALGWLLVANALVAGLLLTLARALRSGWSRSLTLFAVWGGLQANNLVEAFFFGLDIPAGLLVRMLAHQLLVSAALAFAIDRMAGPGADPRSAAAPPRSPLGWAGRVLATDLAYIACYFAAGMAVLPFVQGFYTPEVLPETSHVLAMQVFRGLVFAAIVTTLLWRLGGTRRRAACSRPWRCPSSAASPR